MTRNDLYSLLAALALTSQLSACAPLSETSDAAAQNAKEAIYHSKQKWSDVASYRPHTNVAQFPQTRYCYRMQSDIVCYDSAQSSTTSSLEGYQDASNTSWFQPGGGSTGYSGGPATSQYPHDGIEPLGRPVTTVHAAPVTVVTTSSAEDPIVVTPLSAPR